MGSKYYGLVHAFKEPVMGEFNIKDDIERRKELLESIKITDLTFRYDWLKETYPKFNNIVSISENIKLDDKLTDYKSTIEDNSYREIKIYSGFNNVFLSGRDISIKIPDSCAMYFITHVGYTVEDRCGYIELENKNVMIDRYNGRLILDEIKLLEKSY
jgi:hypothetical protein